VTVDRPIITLLTDFGFHDSFVAQMKGAILGINLHANIVDISHTVDSFNIRQGAIKLGFCYKYFPPMTIHMAVVDPGVGSDQRPIIVVTDKYYFVGPDNGIFSYVYHENVENVSAYHITASHYFLKTKSSTFHGRDIFSPVAAYLSKGVPHEKFGERIEDVKKFHIPEPRVVSKTIIEGEVFYVDHFGNAITNITESTIRRLSENHGKTSFEVLFNGRKIQSRRYYSEVEDKGLYTLLNSSGYVELFVYRGNASAIFNIKVGDNVGFILKKI